VITAAAGNQGPNQIPCPQKIGLERGLFFVVEVGDLDTEVVTDYSGRGNVLGSEASGIRMVPVKDPL